MANPSEKYEEKKHQIIEAAEELFAYYGYSKTTLDDIAQKVKIKKNSIYYYFESKEDLLNAIINSVYTNKVNKFEEEASKTKNTLEKLKLFLSILISKDYGEGKKHNITPNAFLEISLVIENSFKQFYAEAEKLLTKVLREGVKAGDLKKHNSKRTAETILEFTRALEVFELSRSTTKYIDDQIQKKLESRVLQFADLIYNGIKN